MKPGTLALLGALESEVAPLLRMSQAVECERRLGQPVYRGQLGGREVLLAELGIGKVRAAAVLQSLIEHHAIADVICLGSAGALNPAADVGDVIVAERVTQHDYILFTKPNALGGHLEWVKTDQQLSARLLAAGQRLGKRVRLGSIITGDVVVVTGAARQTLWEKFKADCVEMEGAAVGLVCALNEIPFALVRGVSDRADENAIATFKQRIGEVTQTVAEVVAEAVRDGKMTG